MAQRPTASETAGGGRLIKRLRESRGLTQAELADVGGVSLFTVQRVERGDAVKPRTMKAILEGLGQIAKIQREDARRLAGVYGFDAAALDQRLVLQHAAEHAQALDGIDQRELHHALDRALGSLATMPTAIQQAAAASIMALLRAYGPEQLPTLAGASGPSAMHHPPQRVGDHEVTVVEPVPVADRDRAARPRRRGSS